MSFGSEVLSGCLCPTPPPTTTPAAPIPTRSPSYGITSHVDFFLAHAVSRGETHTFQAPPGALPGDPGASEAFGTRIPGSLQGAFHTGDLGYPASESRVPQSLGRLGEQGSREPLGAVLTDQTLRVVGRSGEAREILQRAGCPGSSSRRKSFHLSRGDGI